MAGFFAKLSGIFSGYSEINDDFYEELEETLVMGDVGMEATEEIISELQDKVRQDRLKDPNDCREVLQKIIISHLHSLTDDDYAFERNKSIVLIVGVNGVGKTTTVGKLAHLYKSQGKRVIMAAADTFRAAATEQLSEWAGRVGTDIIRGTEGGDPGAVVYDAIQAAKARNADVLLVDTAGRLHNKKNLMNELKKIGSIVQQEYPDALKETLVVVDAATGQNAKEQAKEFKEVTDVSGVVLTKLDGSAKGGIIVAIEEELDIPVKFVGTGEKVTDIIKFDAEAYAVGLTGYDPAEEAAKQAAEEAERQAAEEARKSEVTVAVSGYRIDENEVIKVASEQEKEDAFAFFRSLRKD